MTKTWGAGLPGWVWCLDFQMFNLGDWERKGCTKGSGNESHREIMMEIATLFSGGEGVGVGAQIAGLEPLWGIEVDDDIASVARINGFDVITADVTLVAPNSFETPTVLHASPPCPNFSTANQGRGETERDLALAEAICRFIEVLCPPVVTLENVYLYRKSKSFESILQALHRTGYRFDYWHLNAADYGVPQTRKRLILVAARGFVPQKPSATHASPDELTPMFDRRKLWVGWYDAIADLVPDLPESKFAPWQKERLPDVIKDTLTSELPRAILVDSAGWPSADGARIPVTRAGDTPCNTVVSNHGRRPMRAFIVAPNSNPDAWSIYREGSRPNYTITPNAQGRMRAFVMSNACTEWGDGIRLDDSPIHTVTEQAQGRTKAFIVTGQTEWEGERVQCRDCENPSFTIPANIKCDWRVWNSGHVIQMTPRALARFQSFPDSYDLPANASLACRVIGNAVPPLMYQRLIDSILTNVVG